MSFTHDLTKLERENQKKLVMEAKAMSDPAKNLVYKVRGPPWRIVEIKKEGQAKGGGKSK